MMHEQIKFPVDGVPSLTRLRTPPDSRTCNAGRHKTSWQANLTGRAEVQPLCTCTGVQTAVWSPDGCHIVLVADFQIRMTIWSLKRRSAIYVRGPKHADRGLRFSPDGTLLAVAEVGRHVRGLETSVPYHCTARMRRSLVLGTCS